MNKCTMLPAPLKVQLQTPDIDLLVLKLRNARDLMYPPGTDGFGVLTDLLADIDIALRKRKAHK